MGDAVLTINGGSSSVKLAAWTADGPPKRLVAGEVQRVGSSASTMKIAARDGAAPKANDVEAPDHATALERLLEALKPHVPLKSIAAVGHRIVHGGAKYREATRITPAVIDELEKLAPIDPAHLPAEIALIRAVEVHLPGTPQVACFDTAFHRDLPRVAQLLPIPRRYEAMGLRRYGFHGLSYTSLMQQLESFVGPSVGRERIVLAHLGAGASMAAVQGGKCVDTTMAFTPTAGLVMGTRTGDLDPGVLVYLMRQEGMDADAIDDLVNRQSGMKGVSGTSADVRDLLAREVDDTAAADALALFCYQARKYLAGLSGVMGGLDRLVFAGGIGENSSVIRARICAGLEFLGIELDAARNDQGAQTISRDHARCAVHVLRTDEEAVILESVRILLQS
jgi:acetate kinase